MGSLTEYFYFMNSSKTPTAEEKKTKYHYLDLQDEETFKRLKKERKKYRAELKKNKGNKNGNLF